MKQRLLQLLILLLCLQCLSSCSKLTRAQYHLHRAIELDSTILTTLNTKVKIDTLVSHDTTIIVKAITDTSRGTFDCDSIKKVLAKQGKVTIASNDREDVDVQNINGKPRIVIHNKEIKVPVHDIIRVQITKTVPAKLVHDKIQVKGFFYWVGVCLTIILGILLIIMIILKYSGIISFFKSIGSRHT